MKRILSVFLLFALVVSFSGCFDSITSTEEFVAVPDILGTDEEVAKSVLSNTGLIPQIKYKYDNEVKAGNVIKTKPEAGEKVSKNEKIKVYISKGPSHIEASDARITWYNISYGDDDWEFYTPYIEDEVLYIECHDVMFCESIMWQDNYDEGIIIGDASIKDTFDKTVPCTAVYEKQYWDAYEPQDFTLEIPLSDLNVERPTEMHILLCAEVDYEYTEINVSFTFTWDKD